tara:strand:- start:791 stop:2665 length:1875 start_codon:yes stop_codon:yes gene_type:complete
MANTFKLKRSSVQNRVPTTSDLDLGELAWNSYDGKLYGKKDDGTAAVVEIGASSGGIASVVADTSPQLGGNLDVNGKNIVLADSAASTDDRIVFGADTDMSIYHGTVGSYTLSVIATDQLYFYNEDSSTELASLIPRIFQIKGTGGNARLQLWDSGNSHYVKLESPALTSNTSFVLPSSNGTSGQALTTDGYGTTSWTTISSGGLSNVVEDTTPQLGGDLELNSNDITGTGDINITGAISVTSTDAGSGAGPFIDLYRNSASPSNNDTLGKIRFYGENDNDEKILYSSIYAYAGDETDGTEDARLYLDVISAGSDSNRIMLQGGGNTKFMNKNVMLTTGVDLVFEGASSNAHETTLTVTDPTQDNTITLPDSTGTVVINSSGSVTIEGDGSSNQGKCILNCENNSHNVTLQAPAHANFSSSWSMTLPGSAGTNGQVLTTNGSGVCSWTTVSGGGGGGGGASAITMNDNVNINWGTGADFEMHCDGSDMHMDMNSTGADNLLIRDGTTTRFTFARATGNLTATGNVTAYSDARLKSDIQPIIDAKKKLSKIRGVTFNRKDIEGSARSAGVIAQEVEKVLPEVVSEDSAGIKSVAYGNLLALCIEAIKEQQTEINELKAHIYDQGK